MKAEELKDRLQNTSQVEDLLSLLSADGDRKAYLNGQVGSSMAFYVERIVNELNGVHLFVLNDKEEAAYFQNDLENLMGDKIQFYPSSYRFPYQEDHRDRSNVLLRAEVLKDFNHRKTRQIIVTHPEALSEKVVTKKHLKKNTLDIKVGDSLSIDFVNEVLFECEFERVDFVYRPGQFSIRGGILDIFSFSYEEPYRIEFFGDDVDSIRNFEPASQLSTRNISRLEVIPNVEEKILREERSSFMEYLPANTVLWLKNFEITAKTIGEEYEKARSIFNKLENTQVQLPPNELYVTENEFKDSAIPFKVVEWGIKKHFAHATILNFNQSPQTNFNKDFEFLARELAKNIQEGYENVVVASSARQVERLHRIFDDLQKQADFRSMLLPFHEGFIDQESKTVVLTDHQIFNRYQRFRLKKGFQQNEQALTIKELTNLRKGDFVTHIDHGIGTFDGLEKIDVNGTEQEAIRLIYSGGDLLYVSIHSLHRIAKYSSKEGAIPKINKLGSPAWKKLKAKTKSKVKKIAYDLIQLYAKRKSQKGFAYQPDTYLQHELEASFIYEDTPDQEKTTKSVKEDMEMESPMDRLVCGDVGFGKTEIAIRAAFKAATDGKQVAVLAPTTILTFQHFKTFSERLKEFPVKVDYINRFKSAKEQKETLKKLESGEINIMIGTHRLVSKDVKFKDLGLLIIDEEQKFGVGVKDKLKTLRANVDTLTLTATPIPRTLQFSLMGARDLSIISTAPPNRIPVTTEITSFNENIIRDAIYYETDRNGQVFFVHNRIQNIGDVAQLITKICPDVTVGIAHGQMEGHQLEEVMMDFINHEFDVLISTSIIESGLDIPNANTIIINQAQNFGLSDLHQMRGRVGRSNKKAFCYLLAPPLSSLTREARARLNAVSQFSELGSGFNIAMRDLDIRGAGNLLGGEQSGFISEIGFDMYQKILEEAVHEIKQEEFSDLFEKELAEKQEFVKDTQVDTDLEFLIPDDYVNNIEERLSLYKQLSECEREEELADFHNQLTDRFGPVPEVTEHLFDLIRLRRKAKPLGFEKIILKKQTLVCYFVSKEDSPYFESVEFKAILEYIKKNPKRAQMKQKNDKLLLSFSNMKSLSSAVSTLSDIAMKLKDSSESLAPFVPGVESTKQG
jgi:transcription-repair coupling factor (superfamily II helicase)